MQDLEATIAGADTLEQSDPIRDVSAWDPGDRIGRYVVLDKLGAGAMGVVVAAYDPALDRRVAIKLISDPGVPGSPHAHRRLREAQTLAKLSHPNVVAVHDVGEIEKDSVVFIAMEYIAGTTLKRWLEQPHSVREIVSVFLQAGRGLAAAHAAGVIHRDFKPANVMIGDDPQGPGRVRVMDFGLARAQVGDPTHISDGYTKSGRRRMPGTPAYMAPEQHLERAVGPAADQFAFCVALHEALVGVRPFTGETPVEIAYSVTHDSPAAPPRSVPENVRRVLERGLARLPEERFPDMDSLLRELARDPRRARRRWLGASGVVLAFAGVLLAVRRDDATCQRLASEIDEVWASDERAQLRAAITSSATEDVATRAIEELDHFAASWRAQRSAACLDARRGNTEPDLVERRSGCLENAREQFAAVVATLATDRPDGAFEVLAVLPSLRDCADGKVLRLAPPLPPPEIRADVARVRGLLARELTLEVAGRLEEASTTLARAELEAAQLGDEALLAEIESARGRRLSFDGHFEESAQVLADSVWTALRSRHDAVAIRSATRLVYVTGDHLEDTATAELWFGLAQSLLVAAEVEDSLMWADLWQVRGAMLIKANRHEEARAASERALEIARPLQDVRYVWSALQTIALSHREEEHYELSNEIALEAIGVLREAYGDSHPMIGVMHGILGANYVEIDEPERAIAAMREALDSLELTLPSTHFKVLETRWNMCVVQVMVTRHAEAIACLEDMLAVVRDDDDLATYWIPRIVEHLLRATIRNGEFERIDTILAIPRPSSTDAPWVDIGLAEVAMLQGRLEDADRRLEARIAELDRNELADASEVFWARYARTRLALRTHRVALAEAIVAELAISAFVQSGSDAPFFDALVARTTLATGDAHRALPLLEGATEQLLADTSRAWPETAEALVALAQAHAQLGSDHETVSKAAHRAMEIYERLPGYRIDRDALAAWSARSDTVLHD